MDINSMTVAELVAYINIELNKGRSLKDIEINDFKVNDRVIAKRLSRKGYKRINNQFIYESNPSVLDNKVIIKTPEIINSKEIPDYNNLDLSKLKELIDLLEPIKDIIHEYNNRRNIIDIEKNELRPKAITEVKQKLFKIDIDVLSKWEEFVSNHKEFKVQQLISLALEEFINKYD